MEKTRQALEELRGFVSEAYSVCESKGASSEEKTLQNLPNCIQSITGNYTDLTATDNGTYTPSEGFDGFGKVNVDVRGKVKLLKLTTKLSMISNACLDENGRWLGDEFIDTSLCTNIAFNGMSNLKHLNCSNWNTSSLTSLDYFLRGCTSIEYVDVSNFNTSKVTNMGEAFRSATNLKIIDLRNWDVSNVTSVSSCFYQCSSLTSIIGGVTIEEVLANNISCLNGLKVSLGVYATILDRASLRALINGLADLTGQTAQTLQLGATLMAKLTEEDIAIATAKNWSIA